jgi:uncharacterized SAM-binding protein YcdF (DUF218 family)
MFNMVILAGFLVALAGLSARWWLPWIGRWLVMPPNIHQADAIAVFGGNHARTEEAARLYRQGMAPQVWHTGWNSDKLPTDGIIAETNQEFLDTVPEHALHFMNTENTWQDAQAIARFAQKHNVHSVLVITDQQHSRRALCSLHQHLGSTSDITVYYQPVPVEANKSAREPWWQQRGSRHIVFSEYRKLGYYLLHYGLIPWGC